MDARGKREGGSFCCQPARFLPVPFLAPLPSSPLPFSPFHDCTFGPPPHRFPSKECRNGGLSLLCPPPCASLVPAPFAPPPPPFGQPFFCHPASPNNSNWPKLPLPPAHSFASSFSSFLLPFFPPFPPKMIPRIRSTHLRNSQRTHHFQRQFTTPTPIQLELYAAAAQSRRASKPLLEEFPKMEPTSAGASPSSAHSPQPMPNGDLNGGGGGGCSPQQPMAATSSMNNSSSAALPPAASVALDLGEMEMHHFQLRLNVGGRSAQLSLAKIRQRDDRSRLAQFVEKDHAQRLLECDAFLNGTEYYFERSAAVFEHILDYYISGKMHRPMDICPIRWRDELEYWRIPIQALSECCKVEAIARRPGALSPTTPASPDNVYIEPSCPPAEFENVRMGKLRLIIWTFLENPRSSSAAKILSFVSALFVLLSLVCLILSSMPEFQLEQDRMTPVAGIQYLEGCCMFFFSVEYLLRFLVVPQKWEFVRQPLNIIDLLTIVPFLLEACLPLLGVYDVELRNFRGALVVIRVLRLARVARIFKLARYSIGLRAFGETMRRSAAELSMLGMFLLTGIMLFSTAIYFFERDEPNSKFYSIPSAWWWCVATMTTVGYGDLVPVTTGGKVVAAVASVCGIIVLAFPISMIIDKFAESTGHGQAVRLGSRASADEFAAAAAALPLVSNRRASLQAGVFSRGLSRRHRNKSRRYLF